MTDRLRSTLAMHFSNHISRGDWASCLMALRGCAESGTTLPHLPYEKLLPFLVTHGQWETALRLSDEYIAATRDVSHASDSAETSKAAPSDETRLFETMLRVAVAPGAAASPVSWKVAAAVVQRAARRRVRFSDETVRAALSATKVWQSVREQSSAGETCGANRREALQLMYDLLAADHHLRVSAAETGAANEKNEHSIKVQSDIISTLRTVLYSDDATDKSFTLLYEQLRASVAVSWPSAVRIVLLACSGRVSELAYLSAQPAVAERTLYATLQCMFDERVISPPPEHKLSAHFTGDVCKTAASRGSGGAKAPGKAERFGAASRAFWRRELEENTAVELPKWEAVVDLVLATLRLREKNQTGGEHFRDSGATRGDGHGDENEKELMCQLAVAASLALAWPVSQSMTSEWSAERLSVCASRVTMALRALLLHGAVVVSSAEVDGPRLESVIAESFVLLLQAYVRLCEAELKGKDEGESCAYSLKELSSSFPHSNVLKPLGSGLAAGRAVLWDSILFPNKSLESLPLVQKNRCTAAWRSLLRRVFFSNANVLRMLFPHDENQFPTRSNSSLPNAHENTIERTSGRRRRRPLPPGLATRNAEVITQLQRLVLFLAPGAQRGHNALFGFSEVLTHREDMDALGRGLFAASKRDGLSEEDAVDVWRLYLDSVPRQRAGPLLRSMMRVAETEKENFAVSRLALVAVMHERNMKDFTFDEQAQSAGNLLRSAFPRTEAWRTALTLFRQSSRGICQQHYNQQMERESKDPPGHAQHLDLTDLAKHSEKPTTAMHVLNALVLDAAPPRWREALHVMDVLQNFSPAVERPPRRAKDNRSAAWTPLSESERIDLYEALAPLRKRRHWRAAMDLLDSYHTSQRRLGPHDISCFAFAASVGPLSCASRLLSALGPHEKSRVVARAALVAAARHTKRIVADERKYLDKQPQPQRQKQSQEQEELDKRSIGEERVLVLHEAAQVAQRALESWEMPIMDEEDLKFICAKLQSVCAGDTNAARTMFRRSAMLDSPQAKSILQTLVREVSLCHATQDTASALAAYQRFSALLFGMIAPTETMLQLMDLLVTALMESSEKNTQKENCQQLCRILQDTLFMYDAATEMMQRNTDGEVSGYTSLSSHGETFFYRICETLFRLQAKASNALVANPQTLTYAPELICVLVDYLQQSSSRLLRCLPEFISILSALLLSVDGADISRLANPIHTLTCHVQKMQDTMGPVVPLESVFRLRVLHKTISGLQSTDGDDDKRGTYSKRSDGKWDSAVFVMENDALSKGVYQELLNETVESEVVVVSKVFEEKQAKGLAYEDRSWQLCAAAIHTLRFVVQQRYGNTPPLAALIVAISMALRYIHTIPINNNKSNMDVHHKMIEVLCVMQELFDVFYTRLTATRLAFASMPSDSLSAAAAAALTQKLYDATRHTCGFVHLITKCSRAAVQQMEHNAQLDLEWINRMVQLTADVTGVCSVWEEASSLRESCRQELKQNAEAFDRLFVKNHSSMSSENVGTHLVLRVIFASLSGELGVVQEAIEETSNCIQKNEFHSISDMYSKVLTAVVLLQTVKNKSSTDGIALLRNALEAYTRSKDKDFLENTSDAQLRALVALKTAKFGSAWVVQKAFGPFPEIVSAAYLTGPFISYSTEVELAELFTYVLLASSRHITGNERADFVKAMDSVSSVAPHRWDLAWSIATGLPLLAPCNGKAADADAEKMFRHRLTVAFQCSGPWPPGLSLKLILETREESDKSRREYPELLKATTELDAAQFWRRIIRPPAPCGTEPEKFVSRLQSQSVRAASLLIGNALVEKQGDHPKGSLYSQWQCVFDAICTSDASVQFIVIAEMTSLKRFKDFLHAFTAALSSACWDKLCLGAQELLLRSFHALGHTLSLVSSSRIVESSRKALSSNNPKLVQHLCQNDLPLLSFPKALFTTARLVKNVDSNDSTFRQALRLPPATSHRGANVKDNALFIDSPCGFTSLQYAYTVNTKTIDERQFLLSLACSESIDEVATVLGGAVTKAMRMDLLQAAWNLFLIRRMELSFLKEKDSAQRGTGTRSELVLPTEENLSLSAVSAFIRLASLLESKQAQQLIGEVIAHATNTVGGVSSVTPTYVEETLTAIMKFSTDPIVLVDTAAILGYAHSYLTIEGSDSECLSLWPPLSLEMTKARAYVKDFLRHAGKMATQKGRNRSAPPKEQSQITEIPNCSLRHPLAVAWALQQQIVLSPRVAPSRRPAAGLINTLRSYVETGAASFTPPFESTKEQSEEKVFEQPLLIRGSGAGIVVDVFLGLVLKSWPLTGKAAERDRYTIRHVVDAIFPQNLQKQNAETERSEAFLIGYLPVSRSGMQSLTSLLVLRDGLERRGTATAEHVVNLLRMEQLRETFRRRAAHDTGLPLARIRIGQPRREWDLQVPLLFFLRAFLATLTFVNPLGWHGERQSSLDRAYTALLDFMCLHAEESGEMTICSRAIRTEIERIFGPDAIQVIFVATGARKKTVELEEKEITLSQMLFFIAGKWEGHSLSPQHDRLQKQLDRALALPRKNSADVLIVKDEPGQLTSFSNQDGRDSPVLSAVSLALDALRSRAIVPPAATVCRILDEGISATTQGLENSREVAHAVLRFFISVAPLTVVSTPTLERVLSLLAALHISVGHHKGHRSTTNYAKVTCDTLDLVLRRLQYVSLATPSSVLLLCELYDSCKLFVGADQTKLLGEMLLWRCAVESSRIPHASLTVALHKLNDSCAQSLRRGCLQFLLADHSKPHYDAPFVQLGVTLDLRLPSDETFIMQLLRGLEGPDGSRVPWRRTAQLLQTFDNNAYVYNTADLDRMRLCLRVVLLEHTLTLKQSDALQRMWQQTLSELLVLLCLPKTTHPRRCSSAKELVASTNLATVATTSVSFSGEEGVNASNTSTGSDTVVLGLNLIDAMWMNRAVAVALRALHITQLREEWFAALCFTRHIINSLPSSSPGPSTLVWWPSVDSVLFHTLRYINDACDGSAIPIAESISYIQLIAAHSSPPSPAALDPLKREKRAAALSSFVRSFSRHPYLRWADAAALLAALGALAAALSPGPALRRAADELVARVMRRLYRQQSYEALLRFAEAARQRGFPPRGREAVEALTHAASIVLASPYNTLASVLKVLCTDDSSASSLLPSSSLSSSSSASASCEVSIDALLREQSIEEREERARRLRDLLVVGRTADAAAVARYTPALMHTREFGDGCANLIRLKNERGLVRFFDALLNIAGPESEMNDQVRPYKSEETINGIVEEDEEEFKYKGKGAGAENWKMKEYREKGVWFITHVTPVALELALDAFATLANTSEGCGGIGARRAGLVVAAAYFRHTLQYSNADKVSPNNNNKESRVLAPRVVESMTVVLRVLARQVPVEDVIIISDAVDEALREPEKESHNNGSDFGITVALQRIKPVARPLVQLLSGAFPATTARLCDALLNSSLQSSSSSPSPSSTEASDAGWIDFLRYTKAYNAAVLRADMHCRQILSDTLQSDARAALLRWRDRTLFSESHSPDTGNYWSAADKECPAWVTALAVYRACRAFIGHAGMRGAHVARLSKLLTSSGSLSVAVRAARDMFIDSPLQLDDELYKKNSDDDWLGPVVGMDAMLMLCDALQAMKQQCLQIVSSWPGTDEEAVAILREVVMDLTDLNKFVMDGLTMIIQQQQRVDYALAGGSAHAICLIRCITVTLSADDWRAAVLRIIALLPPSERQAKGIALRDAVMESARDSFVLHHALQQNPIHPAHSADCGGFWREVYFIVSSSGKKDHGEDTLLGGDIFAVASADSARRHVAMAHLETLLSLATFAGECKDVFSAMRFLSDAILVRYAIPLTEEAKALVKIACIQTGGPEWRGLFEELTGFAPTIVRRSRVLPKDEEIAQQQQLEVSLNTVSNVAQGMQLMRNSRDGGARLCLSHYQRLLQLLEQERDDHEVQEESEVASFSLTTRESTLKSKMVMELHFAMLQDGIFPSSRVAEQSLRLVSPHPLHVLQYAQALTLLPPVTTCRSKSQKRRIHKEQGVENLSQDELFTNDNSSENDFALSEPMLRLVVEAAEKLPDAFQRHKVTSDEAQEGLGMLAAFVGWISEFSRVPCLERDVIESIVALLSADPLALLNAKSPRSLSCDVRADLVNAIVASRDASAPPSARDPAFVDSLSFISSEDRVALSAPSACRAGAQSALRLLRRQAALHHVLRVADPLLCRLFAALAEPGPTAAALRPLSGLAQSAALVSPALRAALAASVAEQAALGRAARDGAGEARGVAVARAVARAHDVARRAFAPPDATALSRLLAMPSGATNEIDEDDVEEEEEFIDRPAAREKMAEQKDVSKSEEEQAVNAFFVMLRNAQPHADLSLPFAVLMDRLCAAEELSMACRFTALAAKSGESKESPDDIGHLLSQHVVVDCFLIWRLVNALHGREQKVANPLVAKQGDPSKFSLWALRLLDERLRNEQESIVNGEDANIAGATRAGKVISISTLAVIKDIHRRTNSGSSIEKTLGGCPDE